MWVRWRNSLKSRLWRGDREKEKVKDWVWLKVCVGLSEKESEWEEDREKNQVWKPKEEREFDT